MLPWRCNSDHYPIRFGARKIVEKRNPLVKPLPLWIAKHAQFPDELKEHFDKLDHEKPKTAAQIDRGPGWHV
jgi:hypothetical protein